MVLPPAPVAWFRPIDATPPAGRWPEPVRPSSPFTLAHEPEPRGRYRWFTWPVLTLFVALVAHGTAEKLHARLLQWGEYRWPGYAGLRNDLPAPACEHGLPVGPGVPRAPQPPTGHQEALLNDLLGDDAEAAPSTEAAVAAAAACQAAQRTYVEQQTRLTPAVRLFRVGEKALGWLFDWGLNLMRGMLVLLIVLCTIGATREQQHIALRPPRSPRQARIAAWAQIAAAAMLGISFGIAVADSDASIASTDRALLWLWLGGGVAMAAAAAQQLWQYRGHANEAMRDDRPSVLQRWRGFTAALTAVPLYAVMILCAGTYFVVLEHHPTGLAIYVQQLTEHAVLYAHVGLYVWVGMLLKETRLAAHCFAVLRPWRLRPAVLAAIVVAAAALPTAYSGASGIFVMAAGALIYQELRRAGATPDMAMAATAMSGSLGVVLSPCLLVVVIAALNKEVTTAALYGWGRWVFVLTALLYLGASFLLTRNEMPHTSSPVRSTERMDTALRGLLPYAIITISVVAMYRWLLGTRLDEHTAPVILPVLLLACLLWERHQARHRLAPLPINMPWGRSIWRATEEAAGHVGALLCLMAASVTVGGMLTRANVVGWLLASFGSPVLAMAALLVLLVLIGMCMDPYGAVILVSASVADMAHRNGIGAVHFWMVVLVAFELGYLMPPIALNQLLARRVVGEAEPLGRWSFGLPLGVMATALLIVAFGPFLWAP